MKKLLKLALVLPLRTFVIACDYVDVVDALANRIEDAIDEEK